MDGLLRHSLRQFAIGLLLFGVNVSVARAEKQALALGCQAKPDIVHPGESVTVSPSVLYGDERKPVSYSWLSTGGRVLSGTAGATINTSGLAPGQYTVTGRAVQGTKAREQAQCVARFLVRAYDPPSIACRAVPASGPSGTTFDINTTAVSPDNRPLSYSFSSSAGQLTARGNGARLNTKGVAAGVVRVNCFTVDDRGLNASSVAEITLAKPLMPSDSGVRPACTMNFDRDKAHPVQVDVIAQSCLDSLARAMEQQFGSRLVIVGNASPIEAPEAAAERSLNARQYMTEQRHISANRIEARVGETSGKTATTFMVPAGSEFSDPNTQLFDPGLIVRHGAPYVLGPSRTSRGRKLQGHSNP